MVLAVYDPVLAHGNAVDWSMEYAGHRRMPIINLLGRS